MSRKSTLQQKFETALEKSLESESAAERTQALRSAGDLLSPALGELTARAKAAEERLEFEKNSLKEAQTALDAATAELATLRPLADRLPSIEAELADLRTNFDMKVADARKELVTESQQKQFKSEAAERRANEILETAQRQFSTSGLELLMTSMSEVITFHNIPEPDIWNLPKNFNPLFLTLWPGWTRIKAQIFVSLTTSYTEPTEGFRQAFLRLLSVGLPVVYGVAPDPIDNRDVKLAVMTMMAERWQVLTSIQREFEQLQIARQADVLREHHAQMSAQEHEAAWRGEGRTPISVEEQSESTVPLSEHLPGCVCKLCGGKGVRSDSLEPIV